MAFFESLESVDETRELTPLTGCDDYPGSGQTRVFEVLKRNLPRDQIAFAYEIADGLRDRWLETDAGWRIMLGRCLGIFQKPEDKFSLGFSDQTKRKCKATTIMYVWVLSGAV